MIPPILHRTVPETTSEQVEIWWSTAVELHPYWEHRTWRDPLDSDEFPITSPHWSRCTSGAQLAGLVRLEALWHHGGIYIDSDVELFRPLDTLLGAGVFAGWEDAQVIPDAVIGAESHHPAIEACLHLAIERLGEGAHRSGPGVTTDVFSTRRDVLLLPPGSFYPYHYAERRPDDLREANPWAFGAHHWHGSWLTPKQRRANERRRRAHHR